MAMLEDRSTTIRLIIRETGEPIDLRGPMLLEKGMTCLADDMAVVLGFCVQFDFMDVQDRCCSAGGVSS